MKRNAKKTFQNITLHDFSKTDSSKFRRFIASVKKSTQSLVVSDTVVNDGHAIANHFDNYFTSEFSVDNNTTPDIITSISEPIHYIILPPDRILEALVNLHVKKSLVHKRFQILFDKVC